MNYLRLGPALAQLTAQELLHVMDNGPEHQSPVIKALCTRLREAMKGPEDLKEIDGRQAECPVCQANLLASYDESNDLFTLELSK